MNKFIKVHDSYENTIYLNVDKIVYVEDPIVAESKALQGNAMITLNNSTSVTVAETPEEVVALISKIGGEEKKTSEVDPDKLYYLKLKIIIDRNENYLNYREGLENPCYELASNAKLPHYRTEFKRSEYPKIAEELGVDNLLDWFEEEAVKND